MNQDGQSLNAADHRAGGKPLDGQRCWASPTIAIFAARLRFFTPLGWGLLLTILCCISNSQLIAQVEFDDLPPLESLENEPTDSTPVGPLIRPFHSPTFQQQRNRELDHRKQTPAEELPKSVTIPSNIRSTSDPTVSPGPMIRSLPSSVSQKLEPDQDQIKLVQSASLIPKIASKLLQQIDSMPQNDSLSQQAHESWRESAQPVFENRLELNQSLRGVEVAARPLTQSFQSLSSTRLFTNRNSYTLSLAEAMQLAVQNSPELRALQADVIINNQEIVRQDAAFDFSHFMETLYDGQVNPVGSNLDGAQGQLRNKIWSLESGLRKRARQGTELTLAQRFGHQNSNSSFINPNNQATGELGLEILQPLGRGAGNQVNEAGIELARIASMASQATLRSEIQNQLELIVSAYWALVQQRGTLIQLNRSVQRAEAVLQTMRQRQQVDVFPQQLIRTRAAVARRKSEAAKAAFDALSAQEQLLRHLFGESYQLQESVEVVPVTLMPGHVAINDLDSGLKFGIQNRPEIQVAMQDIHSAAVNKRIAENELNPQLDLVFALFGKGLQGSSDFAGSFADQFATTDPSFQIGLNYELPFGNRAARANLTQKQVAIGKLQSELQTVLNNIALEIRQQDIARAQYRETLEIRRNSLDLALTELETIQTRRNLLADGDQIAALYLDNLIQAQERVQQAETELLQTVTGYGVAQARWLKAIGALDQYDLSVQIGK